MGLEFKETKTNTKRFPWKDFLVYDLINQSQPHQPPTFVGVVVKVKANPILQTWQPLLYKALKHKIEENPESQNMKKATFHCSEWVKGVNWAEFLWAKIQLDKSSMD